MTFWQQQAGLCAITFSLQVYLIWQWKSEQLEPIGMVTGAHGFLNWLVGSLYVFIGVRTMAWALWSPERSHRVLKHFRLTRPNALHGRLGTLWQWFLHIDGKGNDRDA